MEESRTVNSLRNLAMNVFSQFFMTFLRFFSRTMFIRYLTVEYLGVGDLFTNILSVLAMADLGMTSALNYALYKPLLNHDEVRLQEIMRFFKKIYLTIAASVTVLGLALVPFLHLLVNLEEDIPNLTQYYILLLLGVSASYLFVYKSALITASQKEYLVTKIGMYTQTLRIILQIVVLYLYQSYTLYLLIHIVVELLDNLWVSKTANRLYPFLKNNKAQLAKIHQKEIFKNIRSIVIYRFGGILMNNTTNIFISVMVGTIFVGMYSNYMLIVGTIDLILMMFFSALGASVGNKNATENKEEQEKVFRLLVFVTSWLVGFCTICLNVLLSPFIQLWLGTQYVLPASTVMIICLGFYVSNLLLPIVLYRETTGIFKETKYVYLLTALFNLGLCGLLGNQWEMAGILLAATMARLLTNFWYEPKILYQKYFQKSSRNYFLFLGKFFLLNLGQLIGLKWLFQQLHLSGILAIVVGLLGCILLINGLNFLVFSKTQEFKTLLGYLSFLKSYGRRFITNKKALEEEK